MKIVLTNGAELFPLIVIGGRRFVQRETRDTLTFVFPASESLEALDALFTAENCEIITIFENETMSYIHKGYVVRVEVCLKPVEITPPMGDEEAVYEDRIFVTMGTRTDLESDVLMMSKALNALALGEG